MGEPLPIRGGQDRAPGDTGWQEIVALCATAGDARRLTVQVLRAFPEQRLADVVGVIPAACAAPMPGAARGQCQTIDAGLATIDVRGPGWVDRRYPVDDVVPELAEAGFDAAHIVALFNGNVPIRMLSRAVAALFPDYVPHMGDEALGPLLADCWRCPLRCCQPPDRSRLPRRPGAPSPLPPPRHSPQA